ncbi:unnamed protein product [Rotaria sordida]|uniref:Uncharacterized protein n=1 Tax=Rotaria sordida TaxID=392033 RepID=A0A815S466_9BILA|nr:unnamed protein product [Rotaria sordida]CAF4055907.1 unnamed protein product [Rotaria sordida]
MKRLLNKDLQHETESSLESDEEEMKINEDSSDTLMKFKDKVTLHEISDIFKLYLDLFCGDNRGGKRIAEFYDVYPEVELAAKSYSIERCANKSADFTALDLAIFIDQNYYELINTTKDKNTNLIRSVPSCRLDLRRWGARFDSNSKRPYFEGHERVDVVCERENFVKYFLDHKDQYYTVSDDENPLWKTPTQNPPSILICEYDGFQIASLYFEMHSSLCLVHDENTFRSGEVSAKRWLFGDSAPFFSKGRGRSVIFSDYLVMHPSGPFFTLDNIEYDQALKKYPELTNIDDDVN